jgi:hypothetical protein
MAHRVRGRLLLLLALCPLAALPGPAAALSLDLTASGDGTVGGQVTFTVAFSPLTSVTGYDLSVAWDPSELELESSSPVFGGFFAAAPDPNESAGTRAASILPAPAGIPTTALFTLAFKVLAAPEDGGFDDFFVFVHPVANAPGVGSPVGQSLVIDNPLGFSADVSSGGVGIVAVPEPSAAALLAAALSCLAAVRRLRA